MVNNLTVVIFAAFGRLNGYKINPNQELIAIGVTNTIGSVFGAYPATGSFSRSALKSKSGVRTPAAGILTAIIVITALYGLTDAFFWIPSAGLSAIIIHAVADLVASPSQVRVNLFQLWRLGSSFFLSLGLLLLARVTLGIYHLAGRGACYNLFLDREWNLHLHLRIIVPPFGTHCAPTRRLLGQGHNSRGNI